MHRIALVPLLAACTSSHIPPAPLPPLVTPPPPAMASGAELVIPGEHLMWEVAADGMTVGRAELIVRDHEVESRFNSDGIASMFADVHEHLVTPIAHDAGVHSVHSALAWLRAWQPRDGAAGTLAIEHDSTRYEVTCEPPVRDELHDHPVIRIVCGIATDDVALTFQLSDDPERIPLRLVAKLGTKSLEANLVSRDLRGSAATPVAPASR